MTKPGSTKEAMIVAAERRFALHGLEGASLRQIAIDSGQRNESVAHYHFGSREGLIRAILNYRISSINERRAKHLAQAMDGRSWIPAEKIAAVVIMPMAEEIFINWRNCYWMRFMSQIFAIDRFRYLADEFESQSPALIATHELMVAMPGIDSTVLGIRRDILRRDVVWGLSRVEEMSFHETAQMCELHIANLIDMFGAGISAAPSMDTLRKAAALSGAGQLDQAG